jgi:hypothetical protein
MASDPSSSPHRNMESGIPNSPRVSEALSPQPTFGPDNLVDEIQSSPPHVNPAPYRSKLRPRVNTFPKQDVTLIEIKQCAKLAKKRLERNSKPAPPSVPGIAPVSSESLAWDNAGQRLTSPMTPSRLWSTSTQFSVTVSTPPSNSSFYIQPGMMNSSDAKAGDNVSRATADSESTGASTATGDTMRPHSLPLLPSGQPPSNESATH